MVSKKLKESQKLPLDKKFLFFHNKIVYRKFYGLKTKPFSYLEADIRFFYRAKQYDSAITKINYFIKGRDGHLYIHGEIGSGKTTMLRLVANTLAENKENLVAYFNAPTKPTLNAFVREIADQFNEKGKKPKVPTKRARKDTTDNLKAFLIKQVEKGIMPILLIDECQNLPLDSLKEIHSLMAYTTIMFVLCGQNELASKIDKVPELKSRMFAIAISSLSRKETENLIKFRWKVASGKGDTPFDSKAVLDSIYKASRGIPREVCKICDLALVFGFAKEEKEISKKTIGIAIKEATGETK